MGMRKGGMESGKRKARESPVMSRCEVPESYKGRVSTKSSPYCTGFSHSLTDEFLVQGHMVAHYNKILSAKAIVDTSTPKSMLSNVLLGAGGCRQKKRRKYRRKKKEKAARKESKQKAVKLRTVREIRKYQMGRMMILKRQERELRQRHEGELSRKLMRRKKWEMTIMRQERKDRERQDREKAEKKNRDQQRRERLEKEGTRFENEMLSASRNSSRTSGRPASAHHRKDTFFMEDVDEQHSHSSENGRPSSAGSFASSSRRRTANNTRKITQSNFHHLCSEQTYRAPSQQRPRSILSHSSAAASIVNDPTAFKSYRDPQQITYSGDLVEKHSHLFKGTNQPFTPRTLKKKSESVLKKCRYYNSPRRKEQPREVKKQLAEKETQVNLDRYIEKDKQTEPVSNSKEEMKADLDIQPEEKIKAGLDSYSEGEGQGDSDSYSDEGTLGDVDSCSEEETKRDLNHSSEEETQSDPNSYSEEGTLGDLDSYSEDETQSELDSYSEEEKQGDSDSYSEKETHRDPESYSEKEKHGDPESYSEKEKHGDPDSYSEKEKYRDSDSYSENEKPEDLDSYSEKKQQQDLDSFSEKKQGDSDSYSEKEKHRDLGSYSEKEKRGDPDNYSKKEKQGDPDSVKEQHRESASYSQIENHGDPDIYSEAEKEDEPERYSGKGKEGDLARYSVEDTQADLDTSEKATQVDLDSLPDAEVSPEAKNLSEAQWVLEQAGYAGETWAPDELKDGQIHDQHSHSRESNDRLHDRLEDLNRQYSLSRLPSGVMKSVTMKKIQAEEEELKYLEFIAGVTNEILMLGLFSNRVIERVFERHIEQNRQCLDEGKMRHLLDILCEDLGCKTEDSPQSPTGYTALGVSGLRRSNDLHLPESIRFTDSMSDERASNKPLKTSAISSKDKTADTWQSSLSPNNTILDASDGSGYLPAVLKEDRDSETLGMEKDFLQATQAEETPQGLNTEEPLLQSADHNSGLGNPAVSQELNELGESFSQSLHVDGGRATTETPEETDSMGPKSDMERNDGDF